jgi:hypothetical protein
MLSKKPDDPGYLHAEGRICLVLIVLRRESSPAAVGLTRDRRRLKRGKARGMPWMHFH